MGEDRATVGTGWFADGFRPTGATPLILFGCLWATFGIVSFVQISHWEREHNRKMAMISAGAVQPQTLYVTRIDPDRSEGQWGIGLSQQPAPSRSADAEVYEQVTKLDGLRMGSRVPAYRIDGKWFVPRFSGGFSWGKWVFLGFGPGPPLLVAAVALAVRAGRKRAALGAAVAIGPGGGERGENRDAAC